MSDKTAIEKAREALNILENVVPKNYDPQKPFNIEDLLDTVISRATLAKMTLSESLAALDAEKPAGDIADFAVKISRRTRALDNTTIHDLPGIIDDLRAFAETYHAARAALDAEKPAADAKACADSLFSVFSDDGYGIELPLISVNSWDENAGKIIQSYAETYHSARCKECVGKLPAFPHRVDFEETTV